MRIGSVFPQTHHISSVPTNILNMRGLNLEYGGAGMGGRHLDAMTAPWKKWVEGEQEWKG